MAVKPKDSEKVNWQKFNTTLTDKFKILEDYMAHNEKYKVKGKNTPPSQPQDKENSGPKPSK